MQAPGDRLTRVQGGFARKGELETRLIRKTLLFGVSSSPFLTEHPCNIEARDERGRTALHIACYAGKLDAVKALVAGGCDVAATDTVDGYTGQKIAGFAGHAAVAQWLKHGDPEPEMTQSPAQRRGLRGFLTQSAPDIG